MAAAVGRATSASLRVVASARATATALLELAGHTHGHVGCAACAATAAAAASSATRGATTHAADAPEYAFEVAASNIRYGRGVTR